jgi:hypothetical protein
VALGDASNSLASVYGLIDGAAQRELLGSGVVVDITAIDETNTKVDPRKIAALCRPGDDAGRG